MRKLIVTALVSLDGYFDGPGGNVMAMPFDINFDPYCAERLRAADIMLLGRTTWEGFQGYWPPVKDNPDASEPEREVSRLNGAIQKVVVSDSLPEQLTGPWAETSRVVRRADSHAHVAELKAQDGKDIIMFGSRTVWNDLLAAGLVDELHVIVGAGIVGGGTPAFQTAPPKGLRLLGTRTFEEGNNIVIRYATS
ncbi:MAG: dihydrofolate reductase family protein [Micromonosporaceae bacterium]